MPKPNTPLPFNEEVKILAEEPNYWRRLIEKGWRSEGEEM